MEHRIFAFKSGSTVLVVGLALLIANFASGPSANTSISALCTPGGSVASGGCFNPAQEPAWSPMGGTAGRPMIAYSIRL